MKAKEKYRGVFEFQKSGDKTSSGDIGFDIRIHASPKVGQDQVSGGVSVLCWPETFAFFTGIDSCYYANNRLISRNFCAFTFCVIKGKIQK